jgi:hypothetical protein
MVVVSTCHSLSQQLEDASRVLLVEKYIVRFAGTTASRTRNQDTWRMSGINVVLFFIIAYSIYGHQPQVGASADSLVAFYAGDRTRILIAAVFSGMAVLNLLWFAAALRTTLADAGHDGWGAAATASSAALGGLFLLLITVGSALAYSIR